MSREVFIDRGQVSSDDRMQGSSFSSSRPAFPKPREFILDHFAQRYIFEKGVDGMTLYERFFADHQNVAKESKELLDFVIQRTTNRRVGVLRSVDYKKFEHAFQVMFLELSGKKEFEAPLEVLTRIFRVISNSQNQEMEADIRLIARRYRQDGVLAKNLAAVMIQLTPEGLISVERDIDKYLLLLGRRKYIAEIGKQYDGFGKLQQLLANSSQLADFNGSHLSQMVVGAGWEEKLKYFTDEENVKKLKDLGFNGYHLSQMVVGAGWEEKLKYMLVHAEAVRKIIEHRKISALLDILDSRSWSLKADQFLAVWL